MVDSIWLEKASSPGQAVAQVAPGEQFLIVASIKNVGDAPASGYYLDVYYDSEYGRGGPDAIAPGEVQVWFVGSLTAQAGTHTTKWIVDPDNQIAEVSEQNNEKDLTFTIGASQSPTLTLTPASGRVGTVVSASGSNYTGTTCQLTATPSNLFSSSTCSISSGALTGNFTVDQNAPAGAYNVTAQTNVGQSDSATSTFTVSLMTYAVTFYTDPASGTVSADGVTMTNSSIGNYSEGQRIHVIANPPAGYSFSGWETNGVSVSNASSADAYMTASNNGSLKVHFTITEYTITVLARKADGSALSGVQVTFGSQNKTTDPSGSVQFSVPAGNYSLNVQSSVGGGPSVQYVFTQWSDGNTANTKSITVSSSATYDARYKTQYYLTVASSYGGPTGQGWYDANSTATFSVTSPAGGGTGTQYVFTGWSSSDTSGYAGTDASHSVTISNPITETASWKTQWQVALAVNPSGGGAITVNGQPSATAWYDDGAVVSIQANPSTGYAFSSWSSDVASITFASSSSASTIATIHGTGTITASLLLKDTTPPVITPTVTPSANGNGWNNGPVTVRWSVSDAESGMASSNGCATTTLSTETPLAGTTLTCTATNGAGLSNSASVTVKIDLTAPTLTLPSPIAEATGASGASVSYDASASDSLSGLNTFSCIPPSGSTFPIATTTVSCPATDKAGNTASGLFAVSVQDKAPPVVTVPPDMTVEATGPSGTVVTFTASALDVVDGSLTATCTPSSGSTFALGSTKATCSVTDKAGNTGSASFNVNVVDRTPPALTLPSDMTVQATSTSGAVVTFSASASDLVDGSVSVTCTPGSGSTFPLGTTKVTCSAKDKAGNSASGSFQVTVPAVTVKLLSSNGNRLSGGVVQYYSRGWKSFGTTGSDGTVSMALPPGTYIFQISYAGASQQKSQNVASDPNVIFQTVQVHSDSGKCTSYIQVATVPTRYHGGGRQAFTQDMELLPGTYMFRFSDKTKDTTYALVVGAVKHIH